MNETPVSTAVRALKAKQSALLISHPDERVETIILTAPPTLKEMQEAVGGYITCVPTYGYRIAYCDEDGLRKGLPVNVYAGNYLNFPDLLVGKVIILIGCRYTPAGDLILDTGKRGSV